MRIQKDALSINLTKVSEMHGLAWLALVLGPYSLISYTVTLEAVARPYIHDFINLQHDAADAMIAMLVVLACVLCFLSKPNYDLVCRRLALMFVLKGVSESITIVPQPGGVQECVGITFWQLKNCADMMFSGHTAFTYLILYRTRFRRFFTFAMAFELVMGNWHYMSDCFMAFIVSYAVEKYFPDESYL